MANHHDHHHNCGCSSAGGTLQTLVELDFERSLCNAANRGQLARVRELLSGGQRSADERDASGYTPLHYASARGHTEIVRVLLAAGAPVDAVTDSGRATSLHRAASAGHDDIVGLLLAAGAAAGCQDDDGLTALHRAVAGRHVPVARRLAAAYPPALRLPDKRGRRPINLLPDTAQRDPCSSELAALLEAAAADDFDQEDT